MTAPSSSPRGERAGSTGTRWNTEVRTTGEVVIPDGPWGGPAVMAVWGAEGPQRPAKPNREARRAMARHARRSK